MEHLGHGDAAMVGSASGRGPGRAGVYGSRVSHGAGVRPHRGEAHPISLEEAILLGPAGLRQRLVHERRRQPKTAREATNLLRTERARYANMETAFRRQCQAMLSRYLDGRVSKDDFVRTFSQQNYRFQVSMYLSGRRIATGRFDNTLDVDEAKALHGKHAQEMKWFHNFVRDMESGSGRMDYHHRIDLYALAGYETYLRGAVLNYPNARNLRWEWKVTLGAEHCDDCLEREKASKRQKGFTLKEIEEVWGFPGQLTECGRRCRCRLSPIGVRYNLSRTRPTKYTAEVARAAQLQEQP